MKTKLPHLSQKLQKNTKHLFLAFCILCSIVFGSCISTKETTVGLRNGNIAPEITAIDSSGKSLSLSELKGKIVLIEFWDSENVLVRRDHFELERLYEQFANTTFDGGKNGFSCFSISTDENIIAWKKAVKDDQISWPCQTHETGGWYSKSLLDYSISQLPRFILIDGNGKIIDRNILIKDLEKTLSNLKN